MSVYISGKTTDGKNLSATTSCNASIYLRGKHWLYESLPTLAMIVVVYGGIIEALIFSIECYLDLKCIYIHPEFFYFSIYIPPRHSDVVRQ